MKCIDFIMVFLPFIQIAYMLLLFCLDKSERYWSLVSAEAEPGYLVTGARIIKKNKIFHIQIEQAKPVLEGKHFHLKLTKI